MRIVDIRELAVAISRYADPSVPSGGLTTSVVAVITDVSRDGKPIVGYGFASIGRFAQGGLIRERFAPRLLAARDIDLMDDAETNLDPFRAWKVMMSGEKPGGHGERCVAVGALDMALWDATAKIAQLALYRLLADRTAGTEVTSPPVSVYAGGGYYYPTDDVGRLSDEVRRFSDLGYRHAKIKIGGAPLAQDLKRIDAAGATPRRSRSTCRRRDIRLHAHKQHRGGGCACTSRALVVRRYLRSVGFRNPRRSGKVLYRAYRRRRSAILRGRGQSARSARRIAS